MTHLSISLLGSPKIAIDGVQIKTPTLRAIPLLAYLALTGVSQSRETLANLLWSESNLSHALGSLRITLWRLNSAGLAEWITLDGNEISLNFRKSVDIDVLDFKNKMSRCTTHGHPPSQVCMLCIPTLAEAAALYHGEFLSGINLSKAIVFDDWRVQEGESLHILYLEALEKLVRGHRTFGDFNLAIHYARIWLSHDRYNETAQHDLLQLYSITGQRAAAVNQYKHYKSFITRDLGIKPSDEITALYKQILSGRDIPPAAGKASSPLFLTADFEKTDHFGSSGVQDTPQNLKKYHALMKETSKRFGGQILQISGDNVTVLFENGNPLHCAITFHLKIIKMDWGKAGPPNIRMVIYSSATDHEHHYSFSTLMRAATNLLSSSWGGQVLVTEQALKQLDLPPGSRFTDRGYTSLYDTGESVHIYELLHPNLPVVEHSPLQLVSPHRVNLPNLSPAFIGREAELNQLTTLLSAADARIVSLIGPGGVGKTRLAVQFAAQIAGQFPDGVFYISLSTVQDPDLLPIVLAETLKFNFYGLRNQNEQLGNYLHRMKTLLVFDNFEHLRIKGAYFLAFLLNQTQNLKILVVSRERLNLISETILEVHGLPIPASEKSENPSSYSSIQLFINTAQRISPSFKYDENAAAIIRICRLVNGLPLGIILASSWVRVFSCSRIAEEIWKNVDFLATTAPDLAPRHRSLRAVFDNSWELLSADERLILCRLSIFQATFTPQAAHEICQASPVLLATFVDKSLLQHRQDNRYEMLNTFHQYAMEKLNAFEDESSAIKTKFCLYYVEFSTQKHRELNSPIQKQAIDELSIEMENIRTAWTWMVDSDLWDMVDKVKELILAYHVILGNFVQGRELFRLALAKLNQLNDPSLDLIRASMMQREAWMTFRYGFTTEGLAGLVKSMEIFYRHNSSWEIAMTSFFLAEAYRSLGNPGQAEINIREALRLLQQDSLPKTSYVIAFTAYCQSVLGTVLMELGQYDLARTNIESSLAIHAQLGTHYATILPTMSLAKLAYLQRDISKSRELYLQALETATRMSDQRNMAVIHNNLSDIYQEMASPSDSYQHLISALQLCNETGDRRLAAIILNNLAFHNLKYLQLPSEAIRTYHESIAIFSDLGDLRGVTYSFYDISKAYLQVGLVEEGASHCLKSLQTAMTLDSVPLILHATHGFAHLYANTGQPVRALGICVLIQNHPQIESDTRQRVMETRAELDSRLSIEEIESASNWAESANLQEAIDLIISENQS